MSTRAPLLVLSGHRTGSSAVMSLFVAMGAPVAESLPPTKDNPRGYFEAAALVRADERLLTDRGCDWTCPPHAWRDQPGDSGVVAEALAEIDVGDLWAMKDPRLLFTGPAWVDALDRAAVVGVHRSIEATARSIARRDRIGASDALAIAEAYARRLADLHEQLGFPLVRFDSPTLLEDLRVVVDVLELSWDEAAAREAYDPSLVHHAVEGDHPLDHVLRPDATASPWLTAAALRSAWEVAAKRPEVPLRRDVGPLAARLVSRAARLATGASGTSGATLLVGEPGATLDGLDGAGVTGPVPVGELEGLAAGGFTHVLAPWGLDRADLAATLVRLRRVMAVRAAAVLAGPVTIEPGPAVGPADVERAAAGSGLFVVQVEPGVPGCVVLSTAPTERLGYLPHADALARISVQRVALRKVRTDLVHRDLEQEQLPGELRELRRERGDLDRAAARTEHLREQAVARALRAEQELAATAAARDRAERELAALRRRRLVRLDARLSRLLRPLRRGAGTAGAARSEPPRRTRAEVVAAIEAARPARHATSGPLVSVVVLTRDGAGHLRTLLAGLDATAYRSFEVVVVDNASSDDTDAVLAEPRDYPVTVLRNETNATFSAGNNQALSACSGELLLFCHNDLEPVTADWLGAMVDVLLSDSRRPSAVGALLVYPDRGDARTDLTVQHRGIALSVRGGAPHARNLPAPDPGDPSLAAVLEVPAATGAALLCRRATYEAVGGFAEGYVYGCEDVDLCLRLRAHGPILVAGDAVLFHNESATQRTVDVEVLRTNRQANWTRYARSWAPRAMRSWHLDRLAGADRWSGRTGRVAVVVAPAGDDSPAGAAAGRLVRALTARGWQVSRPSRAHAGWYSLPGDVDLVVSLSRGFDARRAPSGALTVGWDVGTDKPWEWWRSILSYDVLLRTDVLRDAGEIWETHETWTPLAVPGDDDAAWERAVADLESLGQAAVTAPTVAFRLAGRAGVGSDPATARRTGLLARSLATYGLRCRLVTDDQWDDPGHVAADVAVHGLGGAPVELRAAQLNVLWVDGPPDDLPSSERERYDLVLVGSEQLAAAWAAGSPVPVVHLPPSSALLGAAAVAADRSLARVVVAVGDHPNGESPADWVAEAGFRLALYGSGWEGSHAAEGWRAAKGRSRRLPLLYRSAGAVLDLTRADPDDHGFVPQPVLDALAVGGVPVTRALASGSPLADVVETYDDRWSLEQSLRGQLGDPSARAERGARGRALVSELYPPQRQAAVFADAVWPLLETRAADCDATPFRRPAPRGDEPSPSEAP